MTACKTMPGRVVAGVPGEAAKEEGRRNKSAARKKLCVVTPGGQYTTRPVQSIFSDTYKAKTRDGTIKR